MIQNKYWWSLCWDPYVSQFSTRNVPRVSKRYYQSFLSILLSIDFNYTEINSRGVDRSHHHTFTIFDVLLETTLLVSTSWYRIPWDNPFPNYITSDTVQWHYRILNYDSVISLFEGSQVSESFIYVLIF